MDLSRVVRTRTPAGPGLWVFGSGYLVASGRVLTARHVLAPAGAQARVGACCQVRAWSRGESPPWLPAVVLWLHPDPAVDLAVLAADGIGAGLPPVTWGRLEGGSPVGWTATGFPVAGLGPDDRRAEQAYGRLAPGSESAEGGLALGIESREARPTETGSTGWAGLSGAGVFCGGRLVGVVTEDVRAYARSLRGVRATLLVDDPLLADVTGLTPTFESVGAAPPAAPPTPALPPPTRVEGERIAYNVDWWQDRDELRAGLRGALLDPQPTKRIFCVTGRRGIGKSATVAKVLAEFERPDPSRDPAQDLDGVVYLSTRTGSGTLHLAEIVEALTRLLPEPTAERLRQMWARSGRGVLPSLWRALEGRRCVVVLDNLDDVQDASGALVDQELVELLRSVCSAAAPPRIVTTSQRPLDLPAEILGAVKPFPLEEGLSGEDALRLLRAVATEDVDLTVFTQAQLERLLQQICGIPRGVELLARLIRNPLALAELLDSDAPLDDVMQELVSTSFLALDDAGRRVVELLSAAGVPLPHREIPGLLAGVVEESACEAALRSLVRRREVGYDVRSRREGGPRVRLHPLDADWVRRRLDSSPAWLADLDRRLAAWYGGQRTPSETWRTLADVRAQRLEYDHLWRAGEHEAALAVLAELANFLGRKGEAVVLSAAVAEAEGLPLSRPARLQLQRCRFALEFFSGSLDRAEEALRAARSELDEPDSGPLAAQLSVELGTVQRHRGDHRAAVRTLRGVSELAVPEHLRLDALFELGLALCYGQSWAEAETVAAQMERQVGPGTPRQLQAAPFDLKALARFGAGDLAGALDAAERGITAYEDSPHEDNAGYLYNIRGLVGLCRGDLAFAEQELRRGLRLAVDFGIDRIEGICATNLVWTLLRAGRLAEAVELAAVAAARLSSIGVGAAGTPAALAALLAAPAGASPGEVQASLARAVTPSEGNTDLYAPETDVLASIAAALAARSPSIPAAAP